AAIKMPRAGHLVSGGCASRLRETYTGFREVRQRRSYAQSITNRDRQSRLISGELRARWRRALNATCAAAISRAPPARARQGQACLALEWDLKRAMHCSRKGLYSADRSSSSTSVL